MQTIVFGSGCFWCTEAVFSGVSGVVSATPGYAGGSAVNPSYNEVCTGRTGHAEAVSIEFDPSIVRLETLLELFFKSHDPTMLNRQGNDIGSQYRSIILFTNPGQKKAISRFMRQIRASYAKPIVTEVKKLERFYAAEDSHRNYYAKHPLQPYCLFVIRPKLSKLKRAWPNL